MELSDKLKTLFSLTSTKNNELAKAINIDSAQISRLRTGARKMPRDPRLLRSISDYLSTRFQDEYRLTALYDLTRDVRLQLNQDESHLSDIIYDWMTYNGASPNNQVGHFLTRLNDYNVMPQRHGAGESNTDNNTNTSFWEETLSYRSYLQNEGKRNATIEFCDYLISLNQPGTVKIFSDESDFWLTEDSSLMEEISKKIDLIAKMGYKTIRIFPPNRNMDSAFRDIERWMPAFMAATIRLFSYPWARDELHRLTFFVLPGKVVLHSMSLYGEQESQMTVMTTDAATVTSYEHYFDRILCRCHPMLKVYTLNERNQIFDCLKSICMINESGIYKSNRLSSHTLPEELFLHTKKRATAFVNRMFEGLRQNEEFRLQVLREHVITDICTLPRLSEVRSGHEPIPGTLTGKDTLYYTTEEYCMHLSHIIWYLENCPNYHLILLDENEYSKIVVYTKGDSQALMIKEDSPFTIFEITDHRFSASLSGYLRSIADAKMTTRTRRQNIDLLRETILQLKESE